jgi:hypothetical protein
MLSTRPPEQAFDETLRNLADDWGPAPEELARFLCEYCQDNPEIKAFCRTIAHHFRVKRGGKRSKSGPDKQWTSDRLDDLLIDFVFCEFCHPKKRRDSEICRTLAAKEPRWAGLSWETLRKRLQEIADSHLCFYRYLVRLLASDDPTALGKARVMMGSKSPRLPKLLSRVSSMNPDTRRRLLKQARYWPDHRWDYWYDRLLQRNLSRLDADTRQKLREQTPEQSWHYFHNVLLPLIQNS